MNTSYQYTYHWAGLTDIRIKKGSGVLINYDEELGDCVSFTNAEQLELEIAQALCLRPFRLNAAEYRFVRSILGLSRTELAERVNVEARSIKSWECEKKRTPDASADLKFLALTEWRLARKEIFAYRLEPERCDGTSSIELSYQESLGWRSNYRLRVHVSITKQLKAEMRRNYLIGQEVPLVVTSTSFGFGGTRVRNGESFGNRIELINSLFFGSDAPALSIEELKQVPSLLVATKQTAITGTPGRKR